MRISKSQPAGRTRSSLRYQERPKPTLHVLTACDEEASLPFSEFVGILAWLEGAACGQTVVHNRFMPFCPGVARHCDADSVLTLPYRSELL